MEKLFVEIQNAASVIASPNWADKLSVVISLIAAGIAVIVAWKQTKIANKQSEIAKEQADISDRQNKIALFEKKYEVYCELFKIINIGDQLDFTGPHSQFSLLREIEVICGASFADEKNVNAQLKGILTYIKKSEYVIRQSVFLFSCIAEKDIAELINALMECMIFILKSDKSEIDIGDYEISEFIRVSKAFTLKYLNSMEAELTLK